MYLRGFRTGLIVWFTLLASACERIEAAAKAAQRTGTSICCFALCCNPSYLCADGCKAIELIDVPKEDQRHGIVVGIQFVG